MREFFTSGRAIDVILCVVAVEAAILSVGRRLPLRDVVGQLLAGVLLLLAVRCAVTGADWRWTALLVTASGPAHLFDMWRRL